MDSTGASVLSMAERGFSRSLRRVCRSQLVVQLVSRRSMSSWWCLARLWAATVLVEALDVSGPWIAQSFVVAEVFFLELASTELREIFCLQVG